MKRSTVSLALSLLLFAAALAHVSGRVPLLEAQTVNCNEHNTGAQCGTIETCTAWRLSSGEISKDGAGIGTECVTKVTIYLYRYVDPSPVDGCDSTNDYCGWTGTGAGGSWGGGSGSGGSGGSGSSSDCGDPDLWSDDGPNCDTDTQTNMT